MRVRASNEDREQVIKALQRHTEAGRLTLDEYSDRVGTVYAATTLDDLRAATVDLPVLAPTAPPAKASAGANERQLLWTFVFAVIAVALIGGFYTFFH